MRFTSEADQLAHVAQLNIEQARKDAGVAAQAGDIDGVQAARVREQEAEDRLSLARAMPIKAECRRCGREFSPDEGVELVIAAIVIRQPDQIPEVEVFERGQELHLNYCAACGEESRLIEYLKKR